MWVVWTNSRSRTNLELMTYRRQYVKSNHRKPFRLVALKGWHIPKCCAEWNLFTMILFFLHHCTNILKQEIIHIIIGHWPKVYARGGHFFSWHKKKLVLFQKESEKDISIGINGEVNKTFNFSGKKVLLLSMFLKRYIFLK